MGTENTDDAAPGPAISVCVPTYNNATTLERCLRSVLDQEDADFEILLVDDNSADDSVAIATRMLRPGDRLVRNASRLGLCGNHNRCMELARGRLIQFVHADDRLLPGALRRLSPYFDDPAVGMAFAPRLIDQDDIPWQWRLPTTPHKFFRALRERNEGRSLVMQMLIAGGASNWIGEPTSVMFRRDLALTVGGLREDIYQIVDVDFWFRLMLRSTVCFVPEALAVRTHSLDTETVRNAKSGRSWLDHLRLLTSLIVDPASTRPIRLYAAAWWTLVWVTMLAKIALFGPQRSRLKTLARAPIDEFAHARQLAARF